MDLKEQKAAIKKPQVAKLKALGKGIRIGTVLGDRVLIKPVVPWTEMDEVEKAGLVVIPTAVKKDNTPLPSSGIIVQVGTGVSEHTQNYLKEGVAVLFSKYGGTDFIVDNVDYKIFHTDEIMSTLNIDDAELIQPIAESE